MADDLSTTTQEKLQPAEGITAEGTAETTTPDLSNKESSKEDAVKKSSADLPVDEDSSSNTAQAKQRVVLSEEQKSKLDPDISALWTEQNEFINDLESQATSKDVEMKKLQDVLAQVRKQLHDSQHRQRVLAYNMSNKNQELNEIQTQLNTMLQAQIPSIAAVRNAMYDPVVNLMVQKLREELSATKTKLEETQNELSAWKFTPDSNTGKRLMAKCRLLYQENEELGKVISSGRIAKLEGDLALQKSFSDEVKKSQSELDEFLQELDEDVEGMQGTIYFLQQQLKTAKETLANLQQENSTLKKTLSEQQDELKNTDSRSGAAWDSEDGTRDSVAQVKPEFVRTEDHSEEARELPQQDATEDSSDEPLSKRVKLERLEDALLEADEEKSMD